MPGVEVADVRSLAANQSWGDWIAGCRSHGQAASPVAESCKMASLFSGGPTPTGPSVVPVPSNTSNPGSQAGDAVAPPVMRHGQLHVASDANVVYAVHFYAATHQQWLRTEDAIAQGLPVIISEAGGSEASGMGANDYEEWQAWFDFTGWGPVRGISPRSAGLRCARSPSRSGTYRR